MILGWCRVFIWGHYENITGYMGSIAGVKENRQKTIFLISPGRNSNP
jgi:hypothetical protein